MDLKKLTSGAGTLFNRAKQYTEEKLGQAEKTEYDVHFEHLLDRAEKTKTWTEKILKQTEAMLQPNPSARMEEFMYEKVQGCKPTRQSEISILGQNMIDAGNDVGPGTAYGNALVKCGQVQQKLGQAQNDFVQSSSNSFLQPLQTFLDGDMKVIQKERKLLETKRLDLDAAKAKVRRNKVKDAAGETLPTQDTELVKAEAELRTAQTEFDKQVEVTKLLLEGVSSTHAHHLRCLNEFIEAQQSYYSQCHQHMLDIQKQLGSVTMNKDS